MRFTLKKTGTELLALLVIATLIVPLVSTGAVARASSGWYDSSWGFRKVITVDSTKVSDNLTNFPVLINLLYDNDLATRAQVDGDDILFTDSNGTKLSHEIEYYNDANGKLVAWINVPLLSATTDTDIYMYYGNNSAASQEDVTGTWDSNYVAVWHLSENPAGTAPQMMDSTANGHDGTTDGSWHPSGQQWGLIDGSLDFNSGSDKVKVGTFDVAGGGTGNDGITLETWFFSDKKWDGRFISKAAGTDTNQHWWMLNALKEGSEYLLRFRLKTDGSGTTMLLADAGNPVPLNQWVYAAATYDGSDMRIYQDAMEVADTSKTGTISTDNSVKVALGNQPPFAGDRRFDGLITEVRVSNIARSPEWIETANNNYGESYDFYSLGAEETEVSLPEVTTDSSTLVEETTATLHGTLTDDGGETCQYRFEYGTVSGGSYSNNTGWAGSISTGQSFSANITGLSKGTKYYFIAQAKNGNGTGDGSEPDFLTKPDPPISFTATANGTTQINLSWVKGDGAVRTLIRRKTGDYPIDRNDGFQVYFDAGISTSDTGLSADTTYYYKAWSEVTGSQQWSDSYANVTATTGGGSPPPLPPPNAVGGTIFAVDKIGILLPWLVLFFMLSLAAAGILIPLRKRV